MAWDKKLNQLLDALSSMIVLPRDTFPFLQKADINPAMIAFDGSSYVFWFNILDYANNNRRVDRLVDAVLEKNPDNPYLLAYKEAVVQDYSLGTDIKKIRWKNDLNGENLEKITQSASTLLPLYFLNIGLDKARSVARIVINREGRSELGTGFLLPGNLFLTNNHVLKDPATAGIACIQFNYEEAPSGLPIEHTEFKLDAEYPWQTSLANDWTLVKIKGDANSKFGALKLTDTSCKTGDFVNIIQHPAGRYKKIGLYHNVVSYSGDNVIQYLTDTEPGSSGAPVFNSDWQIVALHHSGGNLLEPDTQQRFLRNEGININKIIADLRSRNIDV
jgi:V8-like Glu-specific endopeptidase